VLQPVVEGRLVRAFGSFLPLQSLQLRDAMTTLLQKQEGMSLV